MKTALFLIFALLTGCVSTQSIVTGKNRAPIAPLDVRIFSTTPAGAEEIALLNVRSGGGGQHAMNLAVEELKKQAAKLGANGVVILGSGVEERNRGGYGVFVASSGTWIADSSTEKKTKIQAKAIYAKEAN